MEDGSRWIPSGARVIMDLLLVAVVSLGGVAAAQSPAGDGARAPAPTVGFAGRPFLERISTPAILSAAKRPDRIRGDLLVSIHGAMRVTARPGGGRVVGIFPAVSRYYRVPLVAWVLRTARGGRFGLVSVPYSGTDRLGWIPLRGLQRSRTPIGVRVDLSRRELTVERLGDVILRFPTATGAWSSPTPTGRYFVTDRVPFAPGSAYGTFAFGISGIQTHLPPGWAAGNQLAIHGTNDRGSIGRSASAGCLRVSEAALAKLKPLLRLGTPVVISP